VDERVSNDQNAKDGKVGATMFSQITTQNVAKARV
jgi:hypothetical protein